MSINANGDPLLGRDGLGRTTAGAHQGSALQQCCRGWQPLVAIGTLLLAAGALVFNQVMIEQKLTRDACPATSDAECAPPSSSMVIAEDQEEDSGLSKGAARSAKTLTQGGPPSAAPLT